MGFEMATVMTQKHSIAGLTHFCHQTDSLDRNYIIFHELNQNTGTATCKCSCPIVSIFSFNEIETLLLPSLRHTSLENSDLIYEDDHSELLFGYFWAA